MSVSIEDGNFDAVEETDGIDITHFYLNEQFPAGVFIVQDGFNLNGDSLLSQNFKLVDFRKLAYLIDPNMELNNSYMPFKK